MELPEDFRKKQRVLPEGARPTIWYSGWCERRDGESEKNSSLAPSKRYSAPHLSRRALPQNAKVSGTSGLWKRGNSILYHRRPRERGNIDCGRLLAVRMFNPNLVEMNIRISRGLGSKDPKVEEFAVPAILPSSVVVLPRSTMNRVCGRTGGSVPGSTLTESIEAVRIEVDS